MKLTESGCIYPRRRHDVVDRIVEADRVVLDRRTGLIHRLNATASFIWELSDGTRSCDDITASVAQRFPGTPDTVGDEVVHLVLQFHDLGLLDDGAPSGY